MHACRVSVFTLSMILRSTSHFSIMEAPSTEQDQSHTVTSCEPCVQNIRCRTVILIITAILATFNLVTDWMNLKQWWHAGGYDKYLSVFSFTKIFLYSAANEIALAISEIYWVFMNCKEENDKNVLLSLVLLIITCFSSAVQSSLLFFLRYYLPDLWRAY